MLEVDRNFERNSYTLLHGGKYLTVKEDEVVVYVHSKEEVEEVLQKLDSIRRISFIVDSGIPIRGWVTPQEGKVIKYYEDTNKCIRKIKGSMILITPTITESEVSILRESKKDIKTQNGCKVIQDTVRVLQFYKIENELQLRGLIEKVTRRYLDGRVIYETDIKAKEIS